MKQIWILVANSEFAQIFRLKNAEITLLHQLEHKESKERVSQLVSDQAGRGQSRGWRQHKYSLNEGEKIIRHEREKFVLELFHLCKKNFDEHQFQKLIIFSSPKVLGDIRHIFNPLLTHCPSIEIDKELSPHWTLNEKIEYMSRYLEIPLKVAH